MDRTGQVRCGSRSHDVHYSTTHRLRAPLFVAEDNKQCDGSCRAQLDLIVGLFTEDQVPVEEAISWLWSIDGLDRDTLLCWRLYNFAPGPAGAWQGKGFRPQEAAQWRNTDLDVGVAARWRDAGFEPADAWLWVKARVPLEMVSAWQAAGIGPVDAADWMHANVTDPAAAVDWTHHYGPGDDAALWRGVTDDAREARMFRDGGFNPFDENGPESASAWIADGFTAREASAWRQLFERHERDGGSAKLAHGWAHQSKITTDAADLWYAAGVSSPVTAAAFTAAGFTAPEVQERRAAGSGAVGVWCGNEWHRLEARWTRTNDDQMSLAFTCAHHDLEVEQVAETFGAEPRRCISVAETTAQLVLTTIDPFDALCWAAAGVSDPKVPAGWQQNGQGTWEDISAALQPEYIIDVVGSNWGYTGADLLDPKYTSSGGVPFARSHAVWVLAFAYQMPFAELDVLFQRSLGWAKTAVKTVDKGITEDRIGRVQAAANLTAKLLQAGLWVYPVQVPAV